MQIGFLFWLFLVGIIVATMQDLKRREVDNWLNLFLGVVSLVFILFGALLTRDLGIVYRSGFLIVVMFLVMNLFYYGRVFAGGDAKLLFAMSLFFLGSTYMGSLANVGIFCLFLMVSGSVYGIVYSGVLWWQNREKVNSEMKKLAVGSWQLAVCVVFGAVLMLLGFVNFLFFLFGGIIFIFPFLFVFAKGLENVSMVRAVSGGELREGDWLVNDVVVYRNKGKGVRGKEVVRANWDGLSLEDLELLRGKRRVLIKEGLPFVPAFLIAFILYGFFRDWFVGLF